MKNRNHNPLTDLVVNHIHTNYVVLDQEWNVDTAITKIRTLPDDNRIIDCRYLCHYFVFINRSNDTVVVC